MFSFCGSPCAAGTTGAQGAVGAEGDLHLQQSSRKAAPPGLGLCAQPQHHTISVCLGTNVHTSASGID